MEMWNGKAVSTKLRKEISHQQMVFEATRLDVIVKEVKIYIEESKKEA